jgi:hypothetical protein
MLRLALWVVTTLFFTVSAVEFTIPTSSLINGVTAGVPFNITWTDAVGDVMLLLIDGISNITVSLIESELLPSHVFKMAVADKNSRRSGCVLVQLDAINIFAQ